MHLDPIPNNVLSLNDLNTKQLIELGLYCLEYVGLHLTLIWEKCNHKGPPHYKERVKLLE